MKQGTARSFIAAYERAGLLPKGSRLFDRRQGKRGRFTIWADPIDDRHDSGMNLTLGIDNVEIGWFHSVAELVATVASAVQLDVHDAVANASFYEGMYRAKREELDDAYKRHPLHQTDDQLTVNGVERVCGCPACGGSYDDVIGSMINQIRATRN